MKRILIAGLLAAAAALPLAQTAVAGTPAPDVPIDIAVPDGHKPYMTAHAEGVQMYACFSAPGGHAWQLIGPRATLTGENGKLLGKHYGGPTWEARDGSTVVGARDAAVSVDPTAIDWLRLKADRTTAGADGDRLVGTTYVQRINTAGGRAPLSSDCTDAEIGQLREIPYSADYVFFKASGS